nr:MAG: hypothetical protein [Bacteriophage sp.]
MRKSANTVNIRQSRRAGAVKQIRAPPQEERQRMRYAVIILTDSTEVIAEHKRAERHRRRREKLRRQRRWYFIKQKLTGIVVLAFTAFAVWLLDGDATIAVLTVPLGLYLVFSREMLITNDFYWQTKEREKRGTDFGTVWRDRQPTLCAAEYRNTCKSHRLR